MLTAADVMTRDVVSLKPETPVRDIAQILDSHHISGAPVVDSDGHVIGVVSEGDLIALADVMGEKRRSWWLMVLVDENTLAREYARAHGRTARDVMATEVITVSETTPLAEIARTLERNGIKRVPVVRDRKLVGIVTRGDLLQTLAGTAVPDTGAMSDQTIRDRLHSELQAQPWAHLVTKHIVVENRVVRLFGLIQSNDERRALIVAAENIPGVMAVEDNLALGPNAHLQA